MTDAFVARIQRQKAFSEKTFGPGDRTKGIVDHIRKELDEIQADSAGLVECEWIDVIMLAIDGAWRAGYAPDDIAALLDAKQAKNEARRWPDWRTSPLDRAIEHIRESA